MTSNGGWGPGSRSRPRGTADRVGRFAGVGVLNTLIDMGVYAILVPHLSIVPSTIISTACGMLFSFLVNAFFVFGAHRVTWKAAVQFFGFNAINLWLLQPVIILALNAVMEPVLGHSYVAALAAKAGSLVVSATINFLVYDRYIWPRTAVPTEAPPWAEGAS
ncbi:GtrA family protein [Georgenia deserti]|uniref:GtrA family protein n=1 Tax=Georgenia deserti TaxID=2093781 RepID=A0ABW4L7J9_9MICO